MFRAAALTLALAAYAASDCANGPFDQCGGKSWDGDDCCPDGYTCEFENDYYSGCNLVDFCRNPGFVQCNGTNPDGSPFTGQTCCTDGFECEKQNDYFSQCMPTNSSDDGCAEPNTQCGGNNWDGPLCCTAGYECTVTNEWYSGCTQIPICTNGFYEQCGGVDANGDDWMLNHDDCCPDGFSCIEKDEYYSQCLSDAAGMAK